MAAAAPWDPSSRSYFWLFSRGFGVVPCPRVNHAGLDAARRLVATGWPLKRLREGVI